MGIGAHGYDSVRGSSGKINGYSSVLKAPEVVQRGRKVHVTLEGIDSIVMEME